MRTGRNDVAARMRLMEGFRPDPQQHAALWEDTLDVLRLSIIRGELPPGTQLVEVELGERLGVSRGPIREALRRLELEGLVVSHARRGAFVVGLTEQDVHEIYSLRLMMETFAIEQAAERSTPEGVAGLKRCVDQMREALQLHDAADIVQGDVAFHRTLLNMAEHRRLLKVWGPVALPVQALLAVADTVYADMATAIDQHLLLVDAIAARDPQRAAEQLRLHLRSGEQIVLNVVRKNGER